MSPPLRAACAACLGLASLTAANRARAQETPAPSPPAVEQLSAAETRQAWYGAPMLVMDAASMGLIIVGSDLIVNNLTFCVLVCPAAPGRTQAANGGAAMFLAGAAGFLLGAPIDHLVHGQSETAVKSFIVRLLLPPATLLSGVGIATLACGSAQGCNDAAIPLTLVGVSMVGTALVDDLLGARENVPAQRSRGWLRMAPQVSLGRSTSIGIAAEF
jgi:hypothetical protein